MLNLSAQGLIQHFYEYAPCMNEVAFNDTDVSAVEEDPYLCYYPAEWLKHGKKSVTKRILAV